MRRVKAEASPQFHQLPMFMTPREIRSQYRPLDGDREDVVDDWDADVEDHRLETDAELFERKLDETHQKTHYGDWYDDRSDDEDEPPQSLHDSVLHSGVTNPISLQFKDQSVGRPQILGGHHRLAVAHAYRPDEPIPVEHFSDAWTARKSLRGKY